MYDVAGLRIVALDTSVPGYHHGELSDEQLAWLADVLATPAPHGTLLALHHPPIPVPMLRGGRDHRAARPATGSPTCSPAPTCAASSAGTSTSPATATFAGIPVSVASASCYTSDPAPVERFVSGVDGHQAFTMLHVYDDRVVHTIVPLAEAPEVSGFPADVAAQVEALTADGAARAALPQGLGLQRPPGLTGPEPAQTDRRWTLPSQGRSSATSPTAS